MPSRNQRFLREYRTWLENKGLSAATVRGHADNASLYIEVFLEGEELRMEDGADMDWLDKFFSEFYIRDSAESTPSRLRTVTVGIRKFYQCMLERGHITPEEYEEVRDTLRDHLPKWLDECGKYNRRLFRDSFEYDDDDNDTFDDDDDDTFDDDDDDDDDDIYPCDPAVTDRMYELAFAFKRAKPWKLLREEEEIFAVRLDGGRVGYCIVTGRGGEYFSLTLYPGEEAFDTFLRMLDVSRSASAWERDYIVLTQDCVQLSLGNRDELDELEVEAVRAYAAGHGIVLRGAHSFPSFARHFPHRVPWPVTLEQDARDITAALEAAVQIPELIRKAGMKPYLLISSAGEPAEMPLLEPDGAGFRLGSVPVPARRDRVFSEPERFNDIAIARLRRMRRSEPLACEIIRLPTPVRAEDGLPPCFPAALIGVDAENGMIIQLGDADGAEYDPDEMLTSVTENLLEEELYPRAILVRTPETEAILRGFCKRAGIELRIEAELPELDEALYELRGRLSDAGWDDPDESLAEMIEQLELLVDLGADIPAGMRSAIRHLAQSDKLPKPLADRLTRLLD